MKNKFFTYLCLISVLAIVFGNDTSAESNSSSQKTVNELRLAERLNWKESSRKIHGNIYDIALWPNGYLVDAIILFGDGSLALTRSGDVFFQFRFVSSNYVPTWEELSELSYSELCDKLGDPIRRVTESVSHDSQVSIWSFCFTDKSTNSIPLGGVIIRSYLDAENKVEGITLSNVIFSEK
jgi:hypothetical protein